MYALECFNDFNSIKVRLNPVSGHSAKHDEPEFQFHKGTIKTAVKPAFPTVV